MFTDSDLAPFRKEKGIGELPADAPRRVVLDRKLCDRLAGATREFLRTMYKDNGSYIYGAEFRFFRVGDYYAAEEVVVPPKDIVTSGYVECLFFRMKDLTAVARLLC